MNELHDLAKKQGWSIDDIPEWGNNSLYLTTMLGGYLQNKETPKEAYNRIASTAATYLNKPELLIQMFGIHRLHLSGRGVCHFLRHRRCVSFDTIQRKR